MTFKYLPSKNHVTSLYGNRIHPISKVKKFHRGVDFSAHTDRNIYTVGNGIIRLATFQEGYGNLILIQHEVKGTQFESLYAHLSKINVKVGQKVSGNDIIGIMGESGNSAGIHLHFELFSPKFSSDFSTALDPLLYIKGDEFTAIQVKLKRAGEPIEIDGYFGKDTMNAIKRFQKKHNLEIDGYCGLSTMRVLDSVQESTEEPPKQVASDNKPSFPQPHKDDNLSYSSPSLQNVVEDILKNDEERKLIVSEAIKSGANEKVWRDKLKDGTISDLDVLGLAVMKIINKNK